MKTKNKNKEKLTKILANAPFYSILPFLTGCIFATQKKVIEYKSISNGAVDTKSEERASSSPKKRSATSVRSLSDHTKKIRLKDEDKGNILIKSLENNQQEDNQQDNTRKSDSGNKDEDKNIPLQDDDKLKNGHNVSNTNGLPTLKNLKKKPGPESERHKAIEAFNKIKITTESYKDEKKGKELLRRIQVITTIKKELAKDYKSKKGEDKTEFLEVLDTFLKKSEPFHKNFLKNKETLSDEEKERDNQKEHIQSLLNLSEKDIQVYLEGYYSSGNEDINNFLFSEKAECL